MKVMCGELADKLLHPDLFRKRVLKKLRGIDQVELPRPGMQQAVAGDFAMLDGLSGRRESGVERTGSHQPVDRLARVIDHTTMASWVSPLTGLST